MLSKVCVARFPGFPPTIMYLAFSFIWQKTEKLKNIRKQFLHLSQCKNHEKYTLIECKKWKKANCKELHCVENNY